MITGSMTFSSSCPASAPKATVTSLPRIKPQRQPKWPLVMGESKEKVGFIWGNYGKSWDNCAKIWEHHRENMDLYYACFVFSWGCMKKNCGNMEYSLHVPIDIIRQWCANCSIDFFLDICKGKDWYISNRWALIKHCQTIVGWVQSQSRLG